MADPLKNDDWDSLVAPEESTGETTDEWAGLVEKDQSTWEQKAGAVGMGASSGMLQMGGMVGGAMIGGRVAGLPGAIGGGIAGLLTGEKAKSVMVGDLEELPPGLRPYAVFGETAGGSMVPAGTITAMGMKGFQTAGTSIAGRWLNRVLETAKNNPKSFMAAETGMSLSAGLFGAGAEVYAPGDPLIRMGAETTGGLFNLSRFTHFAGRKAIDLVNQVRSVWSPAARQTKAGKTIIDALEMAGDDPQKVALLLRDSDFLQVLKDTSQPGVARTAAQKTGSKGLAALEKRLGQLSPDFQAKTYAAAEENLEAVRRLIDHLIRTGDPDALKAAAEMRKDYFKTLVESRIKIAEKAAEDAAMKITTDNPAVRSELSKKASQLVGDALSDARVTEKALWDDVPNDLPGSSENILSRLKWWEEDLSPEQYHHIPNVIRDFLSRVKEAGVVTVKDLKGIRSELTGIAASAALDPARSMEAKVAGELAEAALDDLTSIPGAGDAYEAARSYSRVLNETFTRSFAGRAGSKTKYGAKVPPEVMMRKALATGTELADVQLQELTDATRFMSKYAKDPESILRSEQMVTDMLDIQERLIRLAANESRVIDPKTGFPGKVSVASLRRFIDRRPELMERFPEVRKDLEAAVTSEAARARIQAVTEQRATLVQQKATFAKLVKGSPVRIAETILRSPTMETELNSLIKIAKGRGGGEEAVKGLRASLLEAAMRKSTSKGGQFSLAEFRTALFDPPVSGGKSVIGVMRDNGIIDSVTTTLMNKVLAEADKIIKSRSPDMVITEIEDAPGILYDLVTRVFGAATAGKVAAASGSEAHGLIVAHGGSKAAREIVQKLPNVKIQAILADLLANRPEVVADLIVKQATPEKKLAAARLLNSYLFTSGAYGATELPDTFTFEGENE